jgi:hypothetical protein
VWHCAPAFKYFLYVVVFVSEESLGVALRPFKTVSLGDLGAAFPFLFLFSVGHFILSPGYL